MQDVSTRLLIPVREIREGPGGVSWKCERCKISFALATGRDGQSPLPSALSCTSVEKDFAVGIRRFVESWHIPDFQDACDVNALSK